MALIVDNYYLKRGRVVLVEEWREQCLQIAGIVLRNYHRHSPCVISLFEKRVVRRLKPHGYTADE